MERLDAAKVKAMAIFNKAKAEVVQGAQWWCIDVAVAGRPVAYLGKCHATESEMRAALGAHITITGNHIQVWNRP